MNTLCSWSGGKDSCFALIKAKEAGCTPKILLNVLNEEGKISRSHGIPIEILEAQARCAGLPIHLIQSSWKEYESKFIDALKVLGEKHHLQYAVFGDIDLQAHRDWEEKVCKQANLSAILPLWKQDRKDIVIQMLSSGIKTIIVSCNEIMGESFLGKVLTHQLVEELEGLGVDACGENGEYHTLVLDCPLFSTGINVTATTFVKHDNYWFSNLELVK
ncbi:MAG TPA: diphthine--ammonia ligase [Segetibacter sp.]